MKLTKAIKTYTKREKTNSLKLARLLNIKPPTLYFILRGNENITVETAERLSRVGIVPRFKNGEIDWRLE